MASNLVGQRFGRLVVQTRTSPGYGSGERSKWVCSCDCGGEIQVPTERLTLGKTRSCGCLAAESRSLHSGKSQITHGMSNTAEYRIWTMMKDRCSNPNSTGNDRYAARGVTVCERWLNSFENFYADMGPRPSENHTLDRSNNDGNYEPGNCRWATGIEQQNNRSNNVRYPFQGENLTLPEISRKLNINVETLKTRIGRGWTLDRAFTSQLYPQDN